MYEISDSSFCDGTIELKKYMLKQNQNLVFIILILSICQRLLKIMC